MSWFIINGMRRLFRDAIPAGSETNSVYQILKTQLQPRLPASGTLSTLSAADLPLDVPSADDTANLKERDVIGNKGDAAQTTVGTNRSLMAYSKGTVGRLAVPAKDTTDDAAMRDVVGKKDDTPVEAVGTTKSLAGYVKGLTQLLAQRRVAKCAAASTASATYEDVVNITDKGVLTGVAQIVSVDGSATGGLAIVIDGVTILDDATFSMDSGVGFAGNASLAFNHRFNTSLRIQHKTTSGTAYTKASYTTD